MWWENSPFFHSGIIQNNKTLSSCKYNKQSGFVAGGTVENTPLKLELTTRTAGNGEAKKQLITGKMCKEARSIPCTL